MSMAASVTTKSAPTLEILVLEDQPDLLASIRDALGKRGHRVTAASSGPQALERFDGRRFDVAICDVRLPRPDGIELVRRLRRQQPDSELIVMSPSGAMHEAGGPDDRALHHMTQPLDLERLLTLIHRVAEQRMPKAKMSEGMSRDSSAPMIASPASGVRSMQEAGSGLEPLVDAIKQFERGYLVKALNQCSWQRTRTADMLGISRKTLWQKLKQHRIVENEGT